MNNVSTMMVSETTEVTKQHAVERAAAAGMGLVLIPYPGWAQEVAKMKWLTQLEGTFTIPA